MSRGRGSWIRGRRKLPANQRPQAEALPLEPETDQLRELARTLSDPAPAADWGNPYDYGLMPDGTPDLGDSEGSATSPLELTRAGDRTPWLPELPAEDPAGLEPVPAGLPESAARRLEALADIWQRQARIAGAGPDATMFYRSVPPPPPQRTGPSRPEPAAPEDFRSDALEPAATTGNLPVVGAAEGPPRVIRDWTSRHDDRSRFYDVRSRLAVRVPIQDRAWEIGPVFDQGTTPPLSVHDASGCAGMAAAAAANVLEIATASGDRRELGLLSKDDALGLYDRAQELDDVSGKDYPGTSVLAAMKAGQEAGLWPSYLWAFGTRDVAQAVLQVGAVVIGIPWGPSLDHPDAAGIITPDGDLSAGHALAVVGIVMTRGGQSGPFFVLQQSRGPEHGDRGRVYLHHRHLAGLLAGLGEAAVPTPPAGLPW